MQSTRQPSASAAERYPLVVRAPNDTDIVVERDFDFPAALLFEAWTTPKHVRNWWGCRKTRLSVCDIDLRVGGAWRYVMTQDGQEVCAFNGVYQSIEPPHRLVHTMIFEPMPDHPATVTVEFVEKDGKTRVIETTRHDSRESRDAHLNSGMEQGAREIFCRLAEMLSERLADADGSSLSIEREFDAPRDVVFAAWTNRDAFATWWGPKGMDVAFQAFDPRPNGVSQFSMKLPTGDTWRARFLYRGVNAPSQIVWISSFADADGNLVPHPVDPAWPDEMVVSFDFEESGPKTKLRMKAWPLNATGAGRKVFRDGHGSMRGGFGGTFDQLVEFLAKG